MATMKRALLAVMVVFSFTLIESMKASSTIEPRSNVTTTKSSNLTISDAEDVNGTSSDPRKTVTTDAYATTSDVTMTKSSSQITSDIMYASVEANATNNSTGNESDAITTFSPQATSNITDVSDESTPTSNNATTESNTSTSDAEDVNGTSSDPRKTVTTDAYATTSDVTMTKSSSQITSDIMYASVEANATNNSTGNKSDAITTFSPQATSNVTDVSDESTPTSNNATTKSNTSTSDVSATPTPVPTSRMTSSTNDPTNARISDRYTRDVASKSMRARRTVTERSNHNTSPTPQSVINESPWADDDDPFCT